MGGWDWEVMNERPRRGKAGRKRVAARSSFPRTDDHWRFLFSFVTRNDASGWGGMTTGCGACDAGWRWMDLGLGSLDVPHENSWIFVDRSDGIGWNNLGWRKMKCYLMSQCGGYGCLFWFPIFAFFSLKPTSVMNVVKEESAWIHRHFRLIILCAFNQMIF